MQTVNLHAKTNISHSLCICVYLHTYIYGVYIDIYIFEKYRYNYIFTLMSSEKQ